MKGAGSTEDVCNARSHEGPSNDAADGRDASSHAESRSSSEDGHTQGRLPNSSSSADDTSLKADFSMLSATHLYSYHGALIKAEAQ